MAVLLGASAQFNWTYLILSTPGNREGEERRAAFEIPTFLQSSCLIENQTYFFFLAEEAMLQQRRRGQISTKMLLLRKHDQSESFISGSLGELTKNFINLRATVLRHILVSTAARCKNFWRSRAWRRWCRHTYQQEVSARVNVSLFEKYIEWKVKLFV